MTVRHACLCLSFSLGLGPAYAEVDPKLDPFDMSLEQLMHIEVVSASRRAEDHFSVPSAVHVITARDIERSGATSLGEALRGVPGLVVSRTNNNTWAISARGLNGSFANKQLVLIDGRTVYNPNFGGVYWENQELIMQDIERIEVIRGPGGAVWGANAVNGVINVITKQTDDTQGLSLSGSQAGHHRIASIRYGGQLGQNGAYRVYGKFADRDLFPPLDVADAELGNRGAFVGTRVDAQLTDRQRIRISAELLDRSVERYNDSFDPLTFQPVVAPSEGDTRAGNVLAQWNYSGDQGLEHQLQFFSNHENSNGGTIFRTEFDSYRFGYQLTRDWGDRHHLTLGTEYQHLRYRSDGTPNLSFVEPDGVEDDIGAYINHELRLDALKLVVSAGVRYEHNARGGEALQPKISVGWQPQEELFFWGAVARATRKPSISETNIAALGFPVPDNIGILSPVPFGNPVLGELRGLRSLDNETLDAVELGVRWQPTARWSVDLATFYNEYDDFVLSEFQNVRCVSGVSVFVDPGCIVSSPFVILSTQSSNVGETRSYGAELSTRWVVSERTSFEVSYSYLDLDVEGASPLTEFIAGLFEGSSPRHQASMRWHFSPRQNWRLDGQLRYVGRLDQPEIDSYLVFDLRTAWEPRPGLTIAVLAQELGDRRHLEFVDQFDNTPPIEVRRSVALQLSYQR